MLDDKYMPNLQVEQIASLTRLGARRRGILHDGKICHITLKEFLAELAHSETFSRINFGGVCRQTLGAVLKGRSVIRQPLRMIFLLRGLFGTWRAVERAAESPRNISLGPEPKIEREENGATAKALIAVRELHGPGAPDLYELYVATRREHPSLAKADLFKLLPWETRHVLSKSQRDAADMEALGDAEAVDATMAAYICTKAAILLRQVPAIRLTPDSLLEGHPLAGAWTSVRKFLPTATAAMRSCVERNDRFQTRLRKDGVQKSSGEQQPSRYSA
ncbi:hypothetical protein [Cupriavidus sp. USMAA2-4]|uniref:hypothetical protein n=1 Tax=Cupriavidus sp. USMAA2-4 TaxID=876364 RepID=UPI001E52F399|nr:hypothetical protein [Cupriavidus sp. USMAA2-4]